jgi:hypothetical protein
MDEQTQVAAVDEALEADEAPAETEAELGDAERTKGQNLMDWYGQD